MKNAEPLCRISGQNSLREPGGALHRDQRHSGKESPRPTKPEPNASIHALQGPSGSSGDRFRSCGHRVAGEALTGTKPKGCHGQYQCCKGQVRPLRLIAHGSIHECGWAETQRQSECSWAASRVVGADVSSWSASGILTHASSSCCPCRHACPEAAASESRNPHAAPTAPLLDCCAIGVTVGVHFGVYIHAFTLL